MRFAYTTKCSLVQRKTNFQQGRMSNNFFPKFSKLSPKRDISESEFKTRAKNQSVHPYWQVFKA